MSSRSSDLRVLHIPRPVSDTLKAPQVLAEFLKSLVSIADNLEALQLLPCSRFLAPSATPSRLWANFHRGLGQAKPLQDPHTGLITAMERSCEHPTKAFPLLQDQCWYCVARPHRNMASEEFKKLSGALEPPPPVILKPEAPPTTAQETRLPITRALKAERPGQALVQGSPPQ